MLETVVVVLIVVVAFVVKTRISSVCISHKRPVNPI